MSAVLDHLLCACRPGSVGGRVSLILQRHPIHSALSLIVVMVALAGLYLLMGAEFVAAVQIIVYGGAMMVLFIFVIMLLNAGVEERTNFSQAGHLCGIAAGTGRCRAHRRSHRALQRLTSLRPHRGER